jgi:5-hydroxyisourate hydrolase-like protein (transthyretin family)
MKQLFVFTLIILTFLTSSCDKNVQETTVFSGIVIKYPSNQPAKDINVVLNRMENILDDSLPFVDAAETNSEGRYEFECKFNTKEKYSLDISDGNYILLTTSYFENPAIKQNMINHDTIYICEKSFLKIEFIKTFLNPITSISYHISDIDFISSGNIHLTQDILFGIRLYEFIPKQSDSVTVLELPYYLYTKPRINWAIHSNLETIFNSAIVTNSLRDTSVYQLEY